MHKFKTPNRSFSTRLSLWFTGCSAAILLAAMGVSLYFVYHKAKNDTIIISRHSIEAYTNEISRAFEVAEVAAINITPALIQYIDKPDSLNSLLKPILDNNDCLFGAGIAIDPSNYEDQRKVGIYTCRTGQPGEYLEVPMKTYDTDKWYLESKENKKRLWTRPFYGEDGRKHMTDYQVPLLDAQGRFLGVFLVDITLEWLGKLIDSQKIYETSYIQILDADGQEVLHRGKPLPHDGSYTFAAPIENVGWMLHISFSEADVMKPVRVLRDVLLMLSICGLAILWVLIRFIAGKLTNPVIRFAVAAEDISNGNFNTQLPEVHTEDELMLLRDALDDMQHELSLYFTDLKQSTDNQARMENELQIARKIQLSMLPKKFPPYMYGTMVPAREVGGDLYDFLQKGDNLYFIVGDVSGKGVPASLLMACTCKVFRNAAYHFDSPGRIVTSINHSLSENNDQNIFVTLFVGMLNLSTGLFTYCNAGHNPPLVTSSGKVTSLKVDTNIVAGVINQITYDQQQIQLSPGDRILLYTDGVTEAKDIHDTFFGEEKLRQQVENTAALTPQIQVEALLESVQEFAQNTVPSDDITLFCIAYDKQNEQ